MKLNNLTKEEKREEKAMLEYIAPLQEMLKCRKEDLKKEHNESILVLDNVRIGINK